MILSAGSNTLTTTGDQHDDRPDIEASFRQSAGGDLKSQISGERFTVIERIRLTGTQYRTLLDILKDDLNEKQYTPNVVPDYLTAGDFPMTVTIPRHKKMRHVGGGDKKYYVELFIRGVSYIS